MRSDIDAVVVVRLDLYWNPNPKLVQAFVWPWISHTSTSENHHHLSHVKEEFKVCGTDRLVWVDRLVLFCLNIRYFLGILCFGPNLVKIQVNHILCLGHCLGALSLFNFRVFLLLIIINSRMFKNKKSLTSQASTLFLTRCLIKVTMWAGKKSIFLFFILCTEEWPCSWAIVET